jgi:hypothetical protein
MPAMRKSRRAWRGGIPNTPRINRARTRSATSWPSKRPDRIAWVCGQIRNRSRPGIGGTKENDQSIVTGSPGELAANQTISWLSVAHAPNRYEESTMKQKEWPGTVDEAAGVVLATLSDEDKNQIAGMAEGDLIGLHFGLGMWIRNNLGLWQGNQALMQSIRQHTPDIHPDDVSMVIIEAVWKRLRELAPKVH